MRQKEYPKIAVSALRTGTNQPNPSHIEVWVAGAGRYFISYGNVVAMKPGNPLPGEPTVYLDSKYWCFSNTTARYRTQFLGESRRETERKLKDGTYAFKDLN